MHLQARVFSILQTRLCTDEKISRYVFSLQQRTSYVVMQSNETYNAHLMHNVRR